MGNEELADILEEIAVYLNLNGENPFKVRAYENAARSIRHLTWPLAERYKPETGTLNVDIRGIGTGIKEKVIEILEKKESTLLQELKNQTPAGLPELLKIPGLGAKKIYALHKRFGITSSDELEKLAVEKKIREVEGFGPKSEKNILQGLKLLRNIQNRFYYSTGYHIAQQYLQYLQKQVSPLCMEFAGSLRRKKEVIGDIDIVIATSHPQVMNIFTSYSEVSEVLLKGNTKSSVILQNGIQVDLRNVSQKSFPYALNYFTGSREHNTRLRKIAQSKGYKLNEYGLFTEKGSPLLSSTEKDIYNHLGFPYILPELREDMGEFEYFKENESIRLVKKSDLKGLLHCHTPLSDGRIRLEEIISKAIEEGYEYLGISDHSQSAYYAGGLTEEKLYEQWAEIEELEGKYPDITLLKGIESDILPDGNLDYPPHILEQFDFIIASVHSHFNMSREKMTERVIRAIENPFTTILGHPTGRLLLQREPYSIDMPEILQACQKTGTWIEINGQPKRMDLDWRQVQKALSMGVALVITPDGHSEQMFEDIYYGVNVARKGWAQPTNIMNTLDAGEFMNSCRILRESKQRLHK